MIVLDGTIVNVALPSIRAELDFSETTLVWVVNAYLLSFGGFVLLGGRLGDFFGPRRFFFCGIIIFAVASLACGLSNTRAQLITARAVQGLGGATISAVATSLTLNLFEKPFERAKAIAVLGFVSAAGGSVALLVGGVLTSALNWHWIFFINFPAALAISAFVFLVLPPDDRCIRPATLDVMGATTVTISLTLALFALISVDEQHSAHAETVALAAMAVVGMAAFVAIEKHALHPIVPLILLRSRTIVLANAAAILMAVATISWYFICTLYLQRILRYTPLQVGLAFLPAELATAALSLGLSAKIVIRFGLKLPLVVGAALVASGLFLFAHLPLEGYALTDILPGMLLLGVGGALAATPLLLCATNGVPPTQSGLVSGVISTSSMMGGAFGLALLAHLAAGRTNHLLASGMAQEEALTGGYQLALYVGAAFALGVACLGFVLPERGSAR